MLTRHATCHLLFISEVKLKLSCARHGFWKFPKTVSICDLWWFFNPTLECVEWCPVSYRIWPYLFLRCTIKTERVMALSRFDLLILTWWRHQWRHVYVTNNLHNLQNIFVWYQSFTVKSSGQTTWQTHKPCVNLERKTCLSRFAAMKFMNCYWFIYISKRLKFHCIYNLSWNNKTSSSSCIIMLLSSALSWTLCLSLSSGKYFRQHFRQTLCTHAQCHHPPQCHQQRKRHPAWTGSWKLDFVWVDGYIDIHNCHCYFFQKAASSNWYTT